MRLLILLLLAAPLSAQQTVVVPDVVNEITIEPTPFVNEITVMTDSAMIANLNANLEALRIQIAERECDTCAGTPTVVRVGQGALLVILGWAVYEFRQWRQKESVPDVHNDGDVTVNNKVETHKHDRKYDDGH